MNKALEKFFKDRQKEGHSDVIDAPVIFVRDTKEDIGGDIVIAATEDPQIKSVRLINNKPIEVYYYAFTENAFGWEQYDKQGNIIKFLAGEKYRQCECILFPEKHPQAGDKWILVIETKYAKDYAAASNKKSDYPQSMIEQIISTVEYLRRHQILPVKQKVHALVSFPKVIEDFNSTLFQGDVFIENENDIDRQKQPTNNPMNITQIMNKYKIVIKAANEASIISEKRVKF